MKVVDRISRYLFNRLVNNYYGLNKLDKKLASYIDFNNGFFIEAGANNGISQSNTLYFEKYMSWRGLLIEAIPALAEQCRKNRRKCIVENCALVSKNYPDDHIEMQYCNLMSLVKGGLGNQETETLHLESGKKFLRPDEEIYAVSVPTATLSSILDKHKISKVDLLSLDVEGYEPEVLQGIDFYRHRPVFMLIEVRDRSLVETIISPWYKLIAILSINSDYEDILYEVKGQK